MIYENEELRLRTININAEIERGHTDIKKLRKENDTLRHEIWNLREEYDRLEKLLRVKYTDIFRKEFQLSSSSSSLHSSRHSITSVKTS